MTRAGVRFADAIGEALAAARESAARRERPRRRVGVPPPVDAMTFLVRVAGSVRAAGVLAGVSESTVRAVVSGQPVRPITASLIRDAACRVAADRTYRLCGPRSSSDERPLSRRDVVVIETEHLLAAGESPWQIASRLGLQLDSLRTALVRAGRPDLAERALPSQRTG